MPAELLRRDPNIDGLPKKARYGVSGGLRAGGGLLLLAGLAACGGDNAAQSALKCPQIEIPQDVATYYLMRKPNSIDPNDLIASAQLTNTYGDCRYTKDGVTVAVDVEITARRGHAANLEKTFPVTYFVAVADGQNRILDKATFSAKPPVPLASLSPREAVREPLEQVIPLTNPADGGSYKIVIGFQLPPEQVEFNRSRAVAPPKPGQPIATPGRKTIAPVVQDPRTPPPQ
jgi:hypothetical protein